MAKGEHWTMHFTCAVSQKYDGTLIVIIISIFKEDNVFSMIASLPYGPPVNTDIDYYQTFFGLLIFVSVAMLVVQYLLGPHYYYGH